MSHPKKVAVWRIPLNVELSSRQQYILSPAERERANRFRFEDDRRRFVVAHTALRMILGHCMSAPPESLRFPTGQFGKPELVNGGGWQFNLSHSGDQALLAVTRESAVGIDVEQIERIRRGREAVERYLSAREQHDLAQMPDHERETALARLWVCKEAWLKATGEGLNRPLDSFDVVFESEHPRLLATRPKVEDAFGWTMQMLEVGAPYSAAVVVGASDVDVSIRDFHAKAAS